MVTLAFTQNAVNLG